MKQQQLVDWDYQNLIHSEEILKYKRIKVIESEIFDANRNILMSTLQDTQIKRQFVWIKVDNFVQILAIVTIDCPIYLTLT